MKEKKNNKVIKYILENYGTNNNLHSKKGFIYPFSKIISSYFLAFYLLYLTPYPSF